MARIDSLGNFLTDVADAIREKKGTSDLISAEDFDTEIANLPSSGGLDWSAIGYSEEPQVIDDGYDYAVEIKNNWDSTQTSLRYKFDGSTSLLYMPLVDTSNATRADYMFNNCKCLQKCPALNLSSSDNLSYMFVFCSSLQEVGILNISNATRIDGMFNSCASLKTIPLLNTGKATRMDYMFGSCENLISIPQLDVSKAINMSSMFSNCLKLQTVPELNPSVATNMNNMFNNCLALTDESLNNILKTCMNATSYAGTKTLAQLGFISRNYPTSRIQALSHYQDFINAGWTIGY